MITFADISHHQTTVDLAAYKAAGHDRVILKATEGTGFTDPTFSDRWRRAGSLGLARVAYHYAEAQAGGAAECDHFLAVVNAAGGFGPRDLACLDVEDVDDGPTDYQRADENAHEFTTRAVARGLTRGLLYTGRWYAQPANLEAADVPAGWRQLWLSHYDASVSDAAILLPTGWTRDQLVARQFTAGATVAGVAGLCDYSRLFIDWLNPTQEDDMALTPEEHGWLADVRSGVGSLLGQFDPARAGSLIDKINRTGLRILDIQVAVTAGITADADRDARILGRLDALDLTLSPEDTAALAAALDLDEDRVAAAVQRRLAAALTPGA